jgi:predicted Zn-dependent protease with MMP-like domain
VTTLDEVLERLERLDEAGDAQRLGDELARARVQFPDALELCEWEASLAVDRERFEDALAILDRVLAADPRRPWARRERASVLLDLGRLEEALAALRELPREPDGYEYASVHHDLGRCLDRLGNADEADAEFRRAARLAPDAFPVPLRLSDEHFEALVAKALDDVPDEFTRLLGQVVVRVCDYPAPADGEPFLLGLYVGVARPERSLATEDHLDHVLIFKRPHELRCADEAPLLDEVRRTVIHELAHHFGIPHGDIGEYE